MKAYFTHRIPPTCFDHSMTIFSEMHYKGYLHRNITEFSEPMRRYKILNFKNNVWFKIYITH